MKLQQIIGFKGIDVSLIDERGEISAMYNGVPQNKIGIRTDVLENVSKPIGIKMAVRSMAPKVIVADEIGNYNDIEAINYAACSGVKGIFTAHSLNYETMKLNKEKFLKSELGGNLQECVTAWDHWLTELRKFNIDTVGQKYRETRKAADWCQAQWEVFQTVMRQFYNIEYHFSRTDEYFGVCTEDETDWLFKVEREV